MQSFGSLFDYVTIMLSGELLIRKSVLYDF